MDRFLWLLVIALLVLGTFGIYYIVSPLFPVATDNIRGIVPPLPVRMIVQAQNLSVGTDKESGFLKLTLHQGDAGSIRITFARQYTTETVSVKLYFYGRAPNFDRWENTWNEQDMSLPNGLTSSLVPNALEISTDTPYSADLTIVAAHNAQPGSFKLQVDAWISPTKTGNGTSGTGKPFMLEIAPKN
jgi:hypothetical protein